MTWVQACKGRLEAALGYYEAGQAKKKFSKHLSATVFHMKGTLGEALDALIEKQANGDKTVALNNGNIALRAIIKSQAQRIRDLENKLSSSTLSGLQLTRVARRRVKDHEWGE